MSDIKFCMISFMMVYQKHNWSINLLSLNHWTIIPKSELIILHPSKFYKAMSNFKQRSHLLTDLARLVKAETIDYGRHSNLILSGKHAQIQHQWRPQILYMADQMIRVREGAPPDSNRVAFPTCLGRRHSCRVAVCRQQQHHRPPSLADIPARTHMAVHVGTTGELMCAGRRQQRREKEAMESTRLTHPACLCPTR